MNNPVSVSVSLCQMSVTQALSWGRTLTAKHAKCKRIYTLTENKQVRRLVFVFQNRFHFVFIRRVCIWMWDLVVTCKHYPQPWLSQQKQRDTRTSDEDHRMNMKPKTVHGDLCIILHMFIIVLQCFEVYLLYLVFQTNNPNPSKSGWETNKPA